MPLWSCDWAACEAPAAQRAGDCLLCDRHLCRTHLRAPWHSCPKPEEDWESYAAQYAATEARHLQQLCDRIDGAKLCARASKLRGGVPCTVALSPKKLSALMGGQNCHAEVAFEDGVKWLARFPLPQTASPPRQVCDWVLQSEAATLSYLRRHTRIPVPSVFDWASESDPANPLGVGYILMEKLDGKPLDWQAATGEQREKVLQQLVDIYLEIEQHPFDTLGSLAHAAGDGSAAFEVQGLAHQPTFRMGGQGPLGPFSSAEEGARALLASYLAMMASGEISSSCPTNAYLAHRFRLDVVDSLWKEDPAQAHHAHVFLKHPDDKGDHILVNDAFDITGVIDWQWTQTVSKAEAFASPCMMWPVDEFYGGSNVLAADEVRLAELFRERGRQDLADCVVQGRKIQRFFFDLGPDCSFSDQATSDDLLRGLRQAFGYGDEEWQQWAAKALATWKDKMRC